MEVRDSVLAVLSAPLRPSGLRTLGAPLRRGFRRGTRKRKAALMRIVKMLS
jgi:hypothetical protein